MTLLKTLNPFVVSFLLSGLNLAKHLKILFSLFDCFALS